MKRLIVCLVMTAMSVASAASGAIFQDDFDSYQLWQPPPDPPWDLSQSTGGTATVADTVSVSPQNSLHLLDDTPSGGIRMHHALDAPLNGRYQLDYDLKLHDLSLHNGGVLVYGDAGADYSVQYSNGQHGGTEGWFGIYSGGGFIGVDLLEHSGDPGSWYHVTRTLNLETNVGEFKMWERADPSNEESHPIGSEKANTFIDLLSVETSGGAKANMYIDNIQLAIPEPSTLVLVGLGAIGLLAYGRRRRRRQ